MQTASPHKPMPIERLQGAFLQHIREQEAPVTVFLINGVKLQGVVAGFDNFAIMLVRDGFSQIVYKHAISTIMPVSPIRLEAESSKAGT
jgi:host factor-I protein